VISPLLRDAVQDHRLKDTPIHVLVYLHTVLTYGEFRAVKIEAIATAISKSRRRVSVALDRLAEFGYIRAGDKQERNVRSYMLLMNRGEPAKQRPTAA
jgi:DNA-binding transcriptional ArsR family regulator